MSEPVSEIVMYLEVADKGDYKILGGVWMEAQGKMEKEIPQLKTELENEFREILGVSKAPVK